MTNIHTDTFNNTQNGNSLKHAENKSVNYNTQNKNSSNHNTENESYLSYNTKNKASQNTNDEIVDETLKKHIDNEQVAQSYLLMDADTIKLKRIVNWFARAYGVKVTDYFTLAPMPGAQSIQVEATKEFILKSYLSAVGEKKLFVITDVSLMTIPAQNKILKTIEDAKSNECFLLCASRSSTVLDTIKSRCVTIFPAPISPIIHEGISFSSLTDLSHFQENKQAKIIFSACKKLLSCDRIDDIIDDLPILTARENLPLTFLALDNHLSEMLKHAQDDFTITKVNDILTTVNIVNRNILTNCNPQNAFDKLLITIFNHKR